MVDFLISAGAWFLNLLGYKAYSGSSSLWLADVPGVTVGYYCLGIQLMYYFAMLVFISPFSAKFKAIGIVSGIAITMVLNFIRIVSLVLIGYYAPKLLFIAHDHIFNIMVFGTLLLFLYRLNQYGKKQLVQQGND